jgi:hypothetical protein
VIAEEPSMRSPSRAIAAMCGPRRRGSPEARTREQPAEDAAQGAGAGDDQRAACFPLRHAGTIRHAPRMIQADRLRDDLLALVQIDSLSKREGRIASGSPASCARSAPMSSSTPPARASAAKWGT